MSDFPDSGFLDRGIERGPDFPDSGFSGRGTLGSQFWGIPSFGKAGDRLGIFAPKGIFTQCARTSSYNRVVCSFASLADLHRASGRPRVWRRVSNFAPRAFLLRASGRPRA